MVQRSTGRAVGLYFSRGSATKACEISLGHYVRAHPLFLWLAPTFVADLMNPSSSLVLSDKSSNCAIRPCEKVGWATRSFRPHVLKSCPHVRLQMAVSKIIMRWAACVIPSSLTHHGPLVLIPGRQSHGNPHSEYRLDSNYLADNFVCWARLDVRPGTATSTVNSEPRSHSYRTTLTKFFPTYVKTCGRYDQE